MSQGSCSSTFEQYVRFVLDGFYGRTSQERSRARVGRLSDSSCPRWTSSGTVWRGAYSMRSSSEWPSDAAVSFLSDALEPAPPVEVLFEPEGMRGDLESSAEKRESLAEEAGRSPRSAGFKYHQGAGAGGVGAEPEQSPTLTADWHNPAVYHINEQIATRDKKLGRGTALGVGKAGDPAFAIMANHPHMVGDCRDLPQPITTADLNANSSAAVAVDPVICMADDNAKAAIDEDMCGSLKVGGSAPSIAQGRMVVRRLTPMECERLQGFQDDWTKVPYRGKPAEECPDGPRYKAIGNSFAVPVVRWIGERIAMADKEDE